MSVATQSPMAFMTEKPTTITTEVVSTGLHSSESIPRAASSGVSGRDGESASIPIEVGLDIPLIEEQNVLRRRSWNLYLPKSDGNVRLTVMSAQSAIPNPPTG
jgi:hypothetical protein